MPIESTDIEFRYSGGAANADPNASLGGGMSDTEWAGGTAHDLFDVISGAENQAATVDYRCIYVLNNHATLTWFDVVAWFSNVVEGGADVALGLDPAGVNGEATTIADETTAPAGVNFSVPLDKASGEPVGDIPPTQAFAVWFRRTATDSAPMNDDGFTFRVEGDTEA